MDRSAREIVTITAVRKYPNSPTPWEGDRNRKERGKLRRYVWSRGPPPPDFPKVSDTVNIFPVLQIEEQRKLRFRSLQGLYSAFLPAETRRFPLQREKLTQ